MRNISVDRREANPWGINATALGKGWSNKEVTKMNIEEIMTRDPVCCQPDTALQEIARLMAQKNCGAIPIVDSPETMKPVGVVTDRDITCRSLALGKNPLEMTAKEVMTVAPLMLKPDDPVGKCCEVMEKNSVRRMLVTDDRGRCVGIVAQADIARSVPPELTAELVKDISRPSYAAIGAM